MEQIACRRMREVTKIRYVRQLQVGTANDQKWALLSDTNRCEWVIKG